METLRGLPLGQRWEHKVLLQGRQLTKCLVMLTLEVLMELLSIASELAAIQGYAEADFTSTSQPTRIAFLQHHLTQ